MESFIFEGIVTALESISHNGGQSFGVTSKLRREKFVQPDGTIEEIPIISGNGMRGLLRDRGMVHLCRALGYGTDEKTGEVNGLSSSAFYFLFSGGTLTSDAGRGLDVDLARKMRNLIPLVGIFGGAMGNQIMPGKIKVGKMMPIVQETAHLIPERFVPDLSDSDIEGLIEKHEIDKAIPLIYDLANVLAEIVRHDARTRTKWGVSLSVIDVDYMIGLLSRWKSRIENKYSGLEIMDFQKIIQDVQPHLLSVLKNGGIGKERREKIASIWEYLQEEMYTRKDDEKNEHLRQLIAPEARKLLAAKAESKRIKAEAGKPQDDTGEHQQMRYYVETIAAGTQMYWKLVLEDVTEIEFEAFLTCLSEFSRFPYIGGKSGVGMGKVKIVFDEWYRIDSNLRDVGGQALDKPIGTLYANHLREHSADIRQALNEIK